MGWGKCMEDNMDAVSERNYNWNSYGYSYSFNQPFVKSIAERNACLYPPKYEVQNTEYHVLKSSQTVNQATQQRKKQAKTYKDKKIICKECGFEFFFSAQKQEQYESMGWVFPKRCTQCRNRKAERTYGLAVTWVA